MDSLPAHSCMLQLPALYGERALQCKQSPATDLHKCNARDCSTEISFCLQGGKAITWVDVFGTNNTTKPIVHYDLPKSLKALGKSNCSVIGILKKLLAESEQACSAFSSGNLSLFPISGWHSASHVHHLLPSAENCLGNRSADGGGHIRSSKLAGHCLNCFTTLWHTVDRVYLH